MGRESSVWWNICLSGGLCWPGQWTLTGAHVSGQSGLNGEYGLLEDTEGAYWVVTIFSNAEVDPFLAVAVI